jgi:hypothetical protein
LTDPKMRERLESLAKDAQKNSGSKGPQNPEELNEFLRQPENAELRDKLRGLAQEFSNGNGGGPGAAKPPTRPDQSQPTTPPTNPKELGVPEGPGQGVKSPAPLRKNPMKQVPVEHSFKPAQPVGEWPPHDPFGITRPIDPNNPFGKAADPDPRAKSMQAFAAFWEQNFGPLDETPELRKALFELSNGSGGFDFDWKDESGQSFFDMFNGISMDGGSGLDDALNGIETGDWKLPSFELPNLGLKDWLGSSSPSPPSISSPQFGSGGRSWWSGGWGSGGGIGGVGGDWVAVAFLVAVLVAGVAVWWFWLRTGADAEAAGPPHGLGPWPVDPHALNTREDVVKAFEYVSVLLCGMGAKMWTHRTIAQALADLALTHGEVAGKLARLYELARYAPLDEPLSRAEVFEARHLVCDLAGV